MVHYFSWYPAVIISTYRSISLVHVQAKTLLFFIYWQLSSDSIIQENITSSASQMCYLVIGTSCTLP